MMDHNEKIQAIADAGLGNVDTDWEGIWRLNADDFLIDLNNDEYDVTGPEERRWARLGKVLDELSEFWSQISAADITPINTAWGTNEVVYETLRTALATIYEEAEEPSPFDAQ